ncbi:bifunctional folylpolyglutamate synthase/dihydrofolate synthase [Desulforegula conservatrix]|uniref:bifunctional folylpolyglutamate synthase/dihydrofolate synthase n=1 Tax=Desulforegula conservatrix TaxID=153026 RepID=UPI00041F75F0|nr:folylpolyglutamate synthase/dihydrofolate synthase family protein [Desulforegula conservatrix]
MNSTTKSPTNSNQAYYKCIQTLFSLGRFGIKPGLETIRHLLEKLGSPEKKIKSVHIAGTNGKGSTASSIASILSASGIKTGLFTSPHLIRFNERISINGEHISDSEVVEFYEKVKQADTGERPATFFEYATAMAFCFFAENGVEYAVIETGMGGRLDATNTITPCASIITTISKDHESFLGNTISSIASDKSGIIKTGVPVITGVRNREALKVIENEAEGSNSFLLKIDTDFSLIRSPDSSYYYKGNNNDFIGNIEIRLNGDHQIDNTALCIAACNILKDQRITKNSIRNGLKLVSWPGRLEYVSKNPFIILDGAHNPEATEKLCTYLKTMHRDKPVLFIIGMMKDKDHTQSLKPIAGLNPRIIITESKSLRAEKAEELGSFLKESFGITSTVIPDLPEAIKKGLSTKNPEEIICITGSLYIVGEAKAFFNNTDFQTAPN